MFLKIEVVHFVICINTAVKPTKVSKLKWKTSKTWFYNLPAAKATQFQGNRHLIVGASYLNQELAKRTWITFFWKFEFFETFNLFLKCWIFFKSPLFLLISHKLRFWNKIEIQNWSSVSLKNRMLIFLQKRRSKKTQKIMELVEN